MHCIRFVGCGGEARHSSPASGTRKVQLWFEVPLIRSGFRTDDLALTVMFQSSSMLAVGDGHYGGVYLMP